MYTVKNILVEPCTKNTYISEEKRADYVRAVITYISKGKMVIYINETNVNLFLRRTQCRSRKGTRFCVKVPTSRGQNIHIVAGISHARLVH